jgi:hypothetical protein
MSQIQTALSQTTLSGYVDVAAQWSPGTDQNGKPGSLGSIVGGPHIPTYSFAKNDGFSLNAVDIALDKPEDSSQWAAGYHVEMMFGPNSEALANAGTTVAGVGLPVGTILGSTGIGSLRQAFIRLHTPVGGNGIDWQVGVFDSILGYESTSDPLNPNYTRSYGYTIEPTTLTGILGTYKVNDEVSISAGIADMWNDNVIQVGSIGGYRGLDTTAVNESQKTYLGSVTLTAPDSMGFLKGATLSGGVIHGINSLATLSGGSETSWYLGATVPTPISMLKVGAAFDYLQEANDTPGQIGKGGDDIWVIGAYATAQATDKLSFNFRGEYFSDSSNTGDLVALYSGNKGEELTATVQYNLWANVLSRAEVRWDHVEHGSQFGAASTTGAPDKNNDFLLALNLIYQF